jgi:uncharacterized hydrophobic protein (TIGR00271 family)
MAVTVTPDIARMRDSVFFEGPDKSQQISRFWILLVLAGIIAAAGVVADSTATVIGAMIVAPLMTPILGTMLSVVLADRANLFRSVLLVVGGAATAIAIGYLVGLAVTTDVVAATNSQVAGRVHPRLIDLLAAFATGVVGSIALVRRDIADTLPGVAIAISLVPPLSVVGLTLESGASREALGALLLFATNVTAILLSGIIVMSLYKVRAQAPAEGGVAAELNRRRAMGVVAALAVVVIGTLGSSTVRIVRDITREKTVSSVANGWAAAANWDVVDVSTDENGVVVKVEGPLPEPDTEALRDGLIARGVNADDVEVHLVPRSEIDLGG